MPGFDVDYIASASSWLATIVRSSRVVVFVNIGTIPSGSLSSPKMWILPHSPPSVLEIHWSHHPLSIYFRVALVYDVFIVFGGFRYIF